MPRAWIRSLEKLPRSTVVIGGVAGAVCTSLLIMFSMHKPLPVPTMSKEWQDASKEYMKFQKMNPISGKSFSFWQPILLFNIHCLY
jgi:hypothetical protein